MPLYEGIALIQEKQAVVLDIGSEYIKCGLSGEAAPRCIVRAEFYCPRERRPRRLHDFRDEQQLYYNLVHTLHHLYFRHVLVNPKERRVVVVESPFCPTSFRETLAKVLYSHFEVSSVCWMPSGVAAAAAAGAAGAALSVGLGARGAEVLPVLGARAEAAAARCGPAPAELVRAGEEVRTYFVGGAERARAWERHEAEGGPPPPRARDVTYVREGRAAVISGETRERAAEVLFRRDRERESVPHLVLRALAAAPRDVRGVLARNILLWGGLAELPGLRPRLAAELRDLVKEPPYSERLFVSEFAFVSAPAAPSCAAWLGGAVWAGAGSAVGARGGRVPDWCHAHDNTPPGHHHWEELAQ